MTSPVTHPATNTTGFTTAQLDGFDTTEMIAWVIDIAEYALAALDDTAGVDRAEVLARITEARSWETTPPLEVHEFDRLAHRWHEASLAPNKPQDQGLAMAVVLMLANLISDARFATPSVWRSANALSDGTRAGVPVMGLLADRWNADEAVRAIAGVLIDDGMPIASAFEAARNLEELATDH